MNKSKIGLFLIILGNVLYLLSLLFSQSAETSFGDFANGLLVGLSIGVNLIGIVLVAMALPKKKDDKK